MFDPASSIKNDMSRPRAATSTLVGQQRTSTPRDGTMRGSCWLLLNDATIVCQPPLQLKTTHGSSFGLSSSDNGQVEKGMRQWSCTLSQHFIQHVESVLNTNMVSEGECIDWVERWLKGTTY
jgi:hypothetical protein